MSRSLGLVIAVALFGCTSSKGGEPVEEAVDSASNSLKGGKKDDDDGPGKGKGKGHDDDGPGKGKGKGHDDDGPGKGKGKGNDVNKEVLAALKKPWNPKWSKLDDDIIAPVWVGDRDKGQLYTPLWRGNSPAIEDYVPAPPDGDCSNLKCTVRVDWSKAANDVHFHIKCKGLMYKPSIRRTEGVDWWPNPFHAAPKDIRVGGYRLWALFGRVNNVEVPVHFYYDPQTQKLMGSSYDFPTPPPGAIDLEFPTAVIIPSLIFHPDRKGFAAHDWHTRYDHVGVEGGAYSYVAVGFPPHDLCQALPLQPAASQLRPYASPWQPLEAGPSFAEVLDGGLTFDMTIDETDEPLPGGVAPYGYSGVAFISNSPFVQGGVPNGHSFLLLAAFTNSPPLHRPVPGGNGKNCRGFVYDPHVNVPRYCEMAPPQQ